MTRRGWAVAILGAWAVALGWLVKRTYFQSTSARLAEAALAVPPGATFYLMKLGGQQIGYAATTIDTLKDTVRVTDELVLDVAARGKIRRTTARSIATLSRALRLQQLGTTFEGDGMRFAAHGTFTPDSVLIITLLSGADSETTRLKLGRPAVLPSLLPLRLAFGGELRPGRTYTTRLFDPLILAERDALVRVVAETTLVVPDSADYDSTAMAWVPVHFDTLRTFQIDQQGPRDRGTTRTSWVDAQGRVVRTTTPVGVTLERSAFEIAYQNFRKRDTSRIARASGNPGMGDIVPTTAIAAGVAPAPTPLGTTRARLLGVSPAGYGAALNGGRQRLARDTLVVEREDTSRMAARYRLPATDTSLLRWLVPEPLVQTGNPRIGAYAQMIIGRERDPTTVAALITHWVARNVRAEPTTALPSALDVVARKRGDCNEHTVLFLALARTAGLPARSAAGLIYAGGRWYLHAWPEVYLGDWVAVDPTFDQFPADAGHLRLTIGGLARQAELVPLIGKLQVEVL